MHKSSTVQKIWCFYFCYSWKNKELNRHLTVTYTHRYIHTHRPISKKNFFFTHWTRKHINQVKTRHRKFWPKTIFPLPNGSRVIEVKKEMKELLELGFIYFQCLFPVFFPHFRKKSLCNHVFKTALISIIYIFFIVKIIL